MLTRRLMLASIAVGTSKPNLPKKVTAQVIDENNKNDPIIFDIEDIMKDVEVLEKKIGEDEFCIQMLYVELMMIVLFSFFRW